MRKITVLMVFVLCLSVATPTSATRRRYIERESATEDTIVGTSIDFRTHTYTDGLPGPRTSTFNPDDLKDYTYDGIPINIPDFSVHTEYESGEINNFSDAIVDFLGWDSMLGVTDYDVDENILKFEPIKGLSANANTTVGYGRRKFGDEPIEFKVRITDKNSSTDNYTGWVGISIRARTTQAPQWRENPGYLLVLKSDVIEVQGWLPDQRMLLVMDNTFVKNKQWHEFLIETEKVDDGLKISLFVDGKEVFSLVDDFDEIPDEGHVAVYCTADMVELMPGNSTLLGGNLNEKAEIKGFDAKITALKVGESKAVFAGLNAQIDEENVNVVPKVVNDRVFVPLRFVADAIGAVVEWNAEYRTVDLNYRGREITLTEGFAEYGVDGVYRKLDAAPFIEHGRLYVPIRAISEAFSKNVLWTDEQIVFILENEQELDNETKKKVFDYYNINL